jgi:hypothetical protein
LSRQQFDTAYELLEPIAPSAARMHHFLHCTAFDQQDITFKLGSFMSAGYQLAPEQEIIYDARMRFLNRLGGHMQGKHLIIRGEAGGGIADEYIGKLTIEGKIFGIGPMVGDCTIYGKRPLSEHTIGILTTDEDVQGYDHVGVYDGYWNISEGRKTFLDRCKSSARRERERQAQFLHDITNPDGLSYGALHKKLLGEYATPGWRPKGSFGGRKK